MESVEMKFKLESEVDAMVPFGYDQNVNLQTELKKDDLKEELLGVTAVNKTRWIDIKEEEIFVPIQFPVLRRELKVDSINVATVNGDTKQEGGTQDGCRHEDSTISDSFIKTEFEEFKNTDGKFGEPVSHDALGFSYDHFEGVPTIETDKTNSGKSCVKETKDCKLDSVSKVGKNYKCELCNMAFSTKGELTKHSRTHNVCYICRKMFTTRARLGEHFQSTHSKERSTDLEFCTGDTFVSHCRKTRYKPFKCSVCNKTFARNEHLKNHNRVHTGEKPFKCKICGKEFALNGTLSRHVRIHSGEKPHRCGVCNKLFLHKDNMKKHLLLHTGLKPYKCNECLKDFALKEHLKNHYRIHTGVKPFQCNVCEKKFLEYNSLTKHFRIHTGERPYLCRYCGKVFRLSEHLTSHIRTHTGEKRHKCEECNKRFSRPEHLRTHARVHSGEKPYKCDICKKQFTQRQHVLEHCRRHMGIYPYKCSECAKQFSQSVSLRRHVCQNKCRRGKGNLT